MPGSMDLLAIQRRLRRATNPAFILIGTMALLSLLTGILLSANNLPPKQPL